MSEIIGLIELSEEEAKESREFYRESTKDERWIDRSNRKLYKKENVNLDCKISFTHCKDSIIVQFKDFS